MSIVITHRDPGRYYFHMSRIRAYLGLLIVIALLVGAGIYAVIRSSTPTVKVKSKSGETVEVTPTDKMRVRTAEKAPTIDISEYRLEVEGLVESQLSLSLDDIKAIPSEERLVELPCVEGWTERATWKGPRLADILEKAGVKDGADNVVFSSPGGYTTSLTLADIRKTDPLLAYEVNGEELPEDQGFPIRLVVPDRLGYKWIKWVTGMELIKGEYQGYWESRGYDNEADATDR